MSKLNTKINKIRRELIAKYGDDILLCDLLVMTGANEDMIPVEEFRDELEFIGLYIGYQPINTAMELTEAGMTKRDWDKTEAYDINPDIRGYSHIIPTGITEFLKCVNADINKIKLKKFLDGE